ncbi:MAG: hypothetical protein FWG81_06250 [Betaproteobacteria bacterium]|nr:hypothetical protein [Betaproteobacteria bacterium]
METLAFPVLLELKNSRRLFVFLLLAHGLAVAACLFTPWPLWGQGLFLLLLAGNFVHALRRLARQPMRIILAENGNLHLAFSSDDARSSEDLLPACACSGALALPWLSVFSWREEGMSTGGTLVLLPDSFRIDGKDSLRRLNIWLRWKRQSD